MGKKSTPDAPDYEAAAEAQGRASLENTQAQTLANRPNIHTPFGSSQWMQDPGTGMWTNRVALDPMAQSALDSQQGVSRDLSRTGASLTGRVADDLANPVDYGDFREFGELGDFGERRDAAEAAAYGRATSRLDPRFDQAESDMDIKLRTQGLVPGDEAYDRAMGNLLRAKNDAYSIAEADANAAGRAETDLAFQQELGTAQFDTGTRQAQIAEELQKRGWTINEINSLISGREVGMPSIPSFTAAGRASAPDYLGAASAGYNAELDAYNARQAGLQGLFSGLGSVAKGVGSFYGG